MCTTGRVKAAAKPGQMLEEDNVYMRAREQGRPAAGQEAGQGGVLANLSLRLGLGKHAWHFCQRCLLK